MALEPRGPKRRSSLCLGLAVAYCAAYSAKGACGRGWLHPVSGAGRVQGQGIAGRSVTSIALARCRRRTAVSASADGAEEGELPRRVALGGAGTLAVLAAVKRFGIDGPPEFDPAPGSMAGRTVLITGGNTGLGRESAIRLAKAGATVVFTARSDAKGKKAAEEIKAASGSSDVHYLQLDLADLGSVKSFRERYSKQAFGDRIDVLMNNAGVMAIPQRQETKDGFEQQLGVNHLGHFALTGELLPLLRKARDARVIAVSSTAHLGATKELMEGDLMAPERYTQWGAYCQSKLANVLFAKELDKRLKEAGVKATAVSCHPGGVDTDLARWTVAGDDDPKKTKQLRSDSPWAESLIKFVTRTVELGANTQIYLAAGADGGYDKSGGQYFDNMAPGLLNSVSNDGELAKQLWEKSEQLTGVKYNFN